MQLQQFVLASLLSALSVLLVVEAQNGPYPPRLSIPGAVPLAGPAVAGRPQFRNEKVVRVRRPVALRAQNTYIPSAAPRIQEEAKPVTESTEDEQPDVFLPQLLREQQLAQVQQAQFQQQANAFLNGDANSIQDSPSLSQLLHEDEPILAPSPQPALTTTRFAERPTPAVPSTSSPINNRPVFNDYGIGSFGTQRFGLERPQQSAPAPAPIPQQPQRVNVIRTRPQVREPRPQYEAQSAPQPAPAPAPVRSRPRPAPARPAIEYNQVQQEEREQPQQRRQRPVAQTIRKWREENEDGSITWGYENDDGSFKEELIGTDCVTKGTYGYIDPDGNKREYHYETGIKCDPNTRETEEELQQNAFINYEQNIAVLPNGLEIDMSQIGKKKSKRPNSIYRN
ncbi:PREDICTED: probable serine/threonine-protein kinase DDB_G0281745 [Rhagoletis zephyria]|uniref:probable serine/threonine-protein kinase DDB_G0281745 n=1 Tax=Rhagoletis zephyria TaxID=28612 RepID=UPI0008112644|nr:PREDICTED: probable serine/threonine-protein kinase DDB_G0281745 [Rhagoletis zephyria]